MNFDEGKQLPVDERKAGIVVEGSIPPFGGSWTHDPGKNELTLQEPPTALSAPKQEEVDHAG